MTRKIDGYIAYDVKLMRPGCVLLQAVMGGTVPNEKLMRMLDHWLLSPTPDLRLYPYAESELDQLIQITNATPKKRGSK